jgi:hypothetical protein
MQLNCYEAHSQIFRHLSYISTRTIEVKPCPSYNPGLSPEAHTCLHQLIVESETEVTDTTGRALASEAKISSRVLGRVPFGTRVGAAGYA